MNNSINDPSNGIFVNIANSSKDKSGRYVRQDIEESLFERGKASSQSEIESIIRQTLIDHSIDNLSNDIFVNTEGYLKNKSGEYLNEDYEKKLREWHEIGDIPIYAFFYYSVQSQDDYEYFFTMCILEEGSSFYAFNDSDDRESS